MTEMKTWAEKLRTEIGYSQPDYLPELTKFLTLNRFFDAYFEWRGETLYIDEETLSGDKERIIRFFSHKEDSAEEKGDLMMSLLETEFPRTAASLKQFYLDCGSMCRPDSRYILTGFLWNHLKKELICLTEQDVAGLVDIAYRDLMIGEGQFLCAFLREIRISEDTLYRMDYRMNPRGIRTTDREAYERDKFSHLVFCLFDENHLSRLDLIRKAAEDYRVAGAWLYMSMHVILSIRDTDLPRLPDPVLPAPAEDVLSRVKAGTFTDEEARKVLLTISKHLEYSPLSPNKTKRFQGIPPLQVFFPENSEVLFGTMFAVAEAHRQIAGRPDRPLFYTVKRWKAISRYLGDELGSLFLEEDFHTRRANRSILQEIEWISGEIHLDGKRFGGFQVYGYLLASMARSHKGSFGEFSRQTAIYLADAKMNGLSAERAARELFERGSLSFMVYLLLRMALGEETFQLSIHQETLLLKELRLNARDAEALAALSDRVAEDASLAAREIFAHPDHETVMTVLEKIGSSCMSETGENLCVCAAIRQKCPASERFQCAECAYALRTKALLQFMISECCRLKRLLRGAQNSWCRRRYKRMLRETILPALDETAVSVRILYGETLYNELTRRIQEALSDQEDS